MKKTTTLFMTICVPVRYEDTRTTEDAALKAAEAAARRALATALEGTTVDGEGRPADLGHLRLAAAEPGEET